MFEMGSLDFHLHLIRVLGIHEGDRNRNQSFRQMPPGFPTLETSPNTTPTEANLRQALYRFNTLEKKNKV